MNTMLEHGGLTPCRSLGAMDRMLRKHARRRAGIMVVEAVVAALILGVAMSLLLPGMSAVRRQRSAMKFETLATVELDNIAAFLPELVPGESEQLWSLAETPALESWFLDRYADAKLTVDVLRSDADQSLIPVKLKISRVIGDSQPEQAVSVVVWAVGRIAVEEPQR